MGSLAQKVDTIREQLGLVDGRPLAASVDEAVFQLGLADQVKGFNLVQKADACLTALGTPSASAAAESVVLMGLPVGADQAPIAQKMGRRAEPLQMEQSSAVAGVDELARWLAAYPVSGGPRGDQLKAYGWFDSQGAWAERWPLHRAAMRGEVEAIHRLCSAGQDPNSKMTAWYDSEPLGWAASLGQLGAVVALIQCGADPLRPANKAGNTPLTDALREGHAHVATFLKEYKKLKKPPATGRDLFDRNAYPNGGPRGDQNVCIISLCCAVPFALCPVHCLSAWGCADPVGCLTSIPGTEHVPILPCSANSINPLWFCAQPLGWASSLGQLHTVMALVKNGANPDVKNASGQTAYSDAARERHTHVVEWLMEWEDAGRPRR